MIRPSFLALKHKMKDKALIKCVEVGVREGYNAKSMLKSMGNIHLTLVDSYTSYQEELSQKKQEDVFKSMVKLLNPYRDRISIIRDTSVKASQLIEDGTLDYVYIDADHSLESVREDIKTWVSKVKEGGILAGHDWHTVGEIVMDMLHEDYHVFMSGIYKPQCVKIPSDYALLCDWWVHKESWVEL